MDNTQILKRWRLILGAESQEKMNALGCGMMTEEDILMDSALAQIYGANGFGGKLGGHGASSPLLTKWLGDLRTLFSPMEIKVIQKDAIERKGLKQLLLEPEMLNELEPDVSTATTTSASLHSSKYSPGRIIFL